MKEKVIQEGTNSHGIKYKLVEVGLPNGHWTTVSGWRLETSKGKCTPYDYKSSAMRAFKREVAR